MARVGVTPHEEAAAIFAELARRGETVMVCSSAEQLESARPDYVLVDASAPWALAPARTLRVPAIAYHCGAPSLEQRLDWNVVLLSRILQPSPDRFDESYCFVGRCAEESADAQAFPWHELGYHPLIYLSPGALASACREALGGLPFCLVEDGPRVPRVKLLERATLAIVRAEAALVEDCARAGVPQLLYAGDNDAAALAGVVEQAGAGLRLGDADLDEQRLRFLVGRAMADSQFCRSAEALREKVRQAGGAPRACDEIAAYRRAYKLRK